MQKQPECVVCWDVAPFTIDHTPYCADHWYTTGYYQNISIDKRNQEIEDEATS